MRRPTRRHWQPRPPRPTRSGLPNYLALGKTAGAEWFDNQSKSILNTIAPTAIVEVPPPVGSVFVSKVTYQATVPTHFGGIFGYPTISVTGVSSATITTPAFVSVTFLLDNSSSMLIAATDAGVALMAQLTPVNASTPRLPAGLTQNSLDAVPGAGGLGVYTCAFACHWDANNVDYYGLARNNNIQLQFDVVQSAVAAAIGAMIPPPIPNQFSVNIYTFGTPNPNGTVLTAIYQDPPGSPNPSAGAMAAAAIQTPVGSDAANTDFPTTMIELAAASSAAGDGSTLATPRKALIIVTDGVKDYPTIPGGNNRPIPSNEGPIDPRNCDAMKALGYSVYVLYTTYFTTPGPLRVDPVLLYNRALAPYLAPPATPGIGCASSPSNYQAASNPADIDAAMTELLKSALGNGGRFTQ